MPAFKHCRPSLPDRGHFSRVVVAVIVTALCGVLCTPGDVEAEDFRFRAFADFHAFGSFGVDEFEGDLDPAFGFGVGAEYLAAQWFSIGLDPRMHFWSVEQNELDGRTIDIPFVPRLRSASSGVELYLGVPVGVSIQTVDAGTVSDTSLGGTVGLIGGLIVGGQGLRFNAEVGYVAHWFSFEQGRIDTEIDLTNIRISAGLLF